jgi:hypothetical protein
MLGLVRPRMAGLIHTFISPQVIPLILSELPSRLRGAGVPRRLTGGVETGRTSFTADEARQVGSELGIDWVTARSRSSGSARALTSNWSTGLRAPATDVTGSDPIATGKSALAHRNESADYYTRLETTDEEAKQADTPGS